MHVHNWLFLCAFCILIMLNIGGITRLTNSGLSITEWKPITGFIPPITEEQWKQEKDKYSKTPEFKEINKFISDAEFKKIYRIEYFHRLFGRISGIIFLLPFLYFSLRSRLTISSSLKISSIFLLGILQAAMGWIMVQSGMKDTPHVSALYLAFHLIIALIMFLTTLWCGLQHRSKQMDNNLPSCQFIFSDPYSKSLIFLFSLVCLQIFFGGLLAGLNGGLIYNTFPLMNDDFIPDGIFFFSPKWKNIFYNPTTVQFIHRLNGFLILFLNIYQIYIASTISRQLLIRTAVITSAILIQIVLGVFTLLHFVPIALAATHQICGFLLAGLILILIHSYSQKKLSKNKHYASIGVSCFF